MTGARGVFQEDGTVSLQTLWTGSGDHAPANKNMITKKQTLSGLFFSAAYLEM
jgi:hypothetical protein